MSQWWASGNAREPQGPQTREAGRLDRRMLGTQRAGVGPAPSQGIFIGRLVIVSGSGVTSGVFIYNGTPALGNPPQIAEVPSGVTTDPYGNAITSSKILMQGNVITESGGIFRTAATAPLIQIDGPHNAVLLYDASSLLAETIASVVTSDGLGNTVQAGFTSYQSNTTYAQLLASVLQFTRTGFTSKPNIGSDASADLALASGQTAANPQQGLLTVVSGTAPAATAILNGAFVLQESAVPAAIANGSQILSNTSGHAEVVSDTNHGDSNNYDIERLTLICATTTINSSTVRVNVFSHHLGVGTYKIRIWMVTQNTTAADAAAWSFAATGGLVIGAGSLVDFESKTGVAPAAAAVQYLASATVTTTFNGQGAANNQQLIVQATVVVTTAGTLTFGGLELVAGNTVTVSAGGQMDIYPVVAT